MDPSATIRPVDALHNDLILHMLDELDGSWISYGSSSPRRALASSSSAVAR